MLNKRFLLTACVRTSGGEEIQHTGLEASGESAGEDASLSGMIGEMLMVGFRGATLEPDALILKAISQGKVGGFILFSKDEPLKTPRNILSPEQTKALIARLKAASPGRLLVAVDQEGGKLQRLHAGNDFRDWPSALRMGAGTPQETLETACSMGRLRASMDFNFNVAPCVDVHRSNSPASCLCSSIFQDVAAPWDTPSRLCRHQQNLLRARSSFPFAGSLQRTLAAQSCNRMFALRTESERAGPKVGKSVEANRPCSLSAACITGLLHGKLAWKGVVISDDLQMNAIHANYSLELVVLLSIESGTDILLFGNNLKYDHLIGDKPHAMIMRLVREGKISRERILESWERFRNSNDPCTADATRYGKGCYVSCCPHED